MGDVIDFGDDNSSLFLFSGRDNVISIIVFSVSISVSPLVSFYCKFFYVLHFIINT